MAKRPMYFLLLACILLFSGCGIKAQDSSITASDTVSKRGDVSEMQDAEPEEEMAQGSVGGESIQYLVQNADFSIDVQDIDEASGTLKKAVYQAGGLIADSSVTGRKGEVRFANLTLRVPADKYISFCDDVKKIGKVNSEREYIDDVTRQYIDLEARIHNLERQEERLLSILEKAETVEDILRVEQELERVRGQLESMTAKFRYLNDRVEYSTVQVSLRETPTASPVITGSGLKGVWERGVGGLVASINAMLVGLGNLVVFSFSALPYLVLILGLSVPVVMFLRRRGRGPQTPQV